MTGRSAKILVVDDDRTELTALSLTLERRGYHVVAVQDPDEVLPLLEKEQPDLLMLDILMPKLDGWELLKRIKRDARYQDTPVLMISVLPPEEATVNALGLGASDFIAKPFRAKELAARVEAQLRAGRALRDARLEAERRATEVALQHEMLDILHEVTEAFAPEEIYRVLARRVANALRVSRCSLIIADDNGVTGKVVVAAEDAKVGNLAVQLMRYPEVVRALETRESVLVTDVRTDPLYEKVREEWERAGLAVTTRSVIAVPFTMQESQRGVFFLRTVGDEPTLGVRNLAFAERVVQAAVSVIEKAYQLENAQSAKQRYEWLARTDSLTGCLNRLALTERLQEELERVQRYGAALGLLMVDLDHFKDVNDARGHLTGDDVLRQIGGLLRSELRTVDIIARYGGEEFVALLPGTGLTGAVNTGERIRQRIASHNFQTEADPLHITASVGVAAVSGGESLDLDTMLARVDAALYRAKHAGRNLVRL